MPTRQVGTPALKLQHKIWKGFIDNNIITTLGSSWLNWEFPKLPTRIFIDSLFSLWIFLVPGWWYQHWLVPTHVVDFCWRNPKILYCCTKAIQGIIMIITIIEKTCQVQEHITVGLGLSSIKAEKLSAKRNVSASNVRRILTLFSHVSPFFSEGGE